ncbi:Uncharacterized membrane protein YcaP, DUF421 family [Salinibacillus kushneri]|uniref:Uncharacterized membrane protein YcaP, DUF421 family n=1 Tax=Salinibacillus kushneri TaxID=237682 RepID=A0A1I0DMZ7_9BACI|nr:YetF domain-containing protein [Salinibacillus kushneri]SET33878.1 Uncharacterized membrane protein YcaP, DUF421 family [Salinibacillus kushneri]
MLSVIVKSVILVLSGVFLLRIAGRKSISQMTLAQTVVMISIGSIIIQPIIEKSVLRTILASAVFILALIVMELLQLKVNFIERLITGKSKVIIKNGQIDVKTLRSLRFSVDQLEMRLRQQGISKISDVKTATLEPNGQIGYELIDEAKPLTVKEFKKLMNMDDKPPMEGGNSLFAEIENKQRNPDKQDYPNHLK